MAYHSLREFVHRLENENELVRIKDHVSPILEITETTDQIIKTRTFDSEMRVFFISTHKGTLFQL